MNGYEMKTQYVKRINEVFQPLTDFGGIGYAHVYTTGAEYIKIKDSVGNSVFLNVTGHDLEHILLEVVAVAIGKLPPSVIRSKKTRRAVEEFFKERRSGND